MKPSSSACILALFAACIIPASSTPVERVVNLLKDIHEKLSTDQQSEQKVYDKFACWCQKTTDRKAHAIIEAEEDLRSLGQTILSTKGRIATLTAELEQIADRMKKNQEAQAQATSIRQKENGVFMANTAESKQAIAALEQAITVLVKGTSLLQASQARAAVRAAIGAIPANAALKKGQLAQLSEFLQASTGSKYSPQSFTVQGILTDMYKTFANDLESDTVAEAGANRDYEDFIALKVAEMKQHEVEAAVREKEKAEKESFLADTQQIYDDTAAQKAAHIEFFDQTKAACLSKYSDWKTRTDLRKEEITGIEEALAILTTDSARELFASAIKDGKETRAEDSYNTGRNVSFSFLQVSSAGAATSASISAYALLKQEASAVHSLRLAALAARVRTAKVGHFDEVVAAINTMIKTLQDEDTADIKKRDECKDEYQKIESTVENVTWLIEKNDAKIQKLIGLIELRTEQKEKTIQEITDVDAYMAELTAERQAENEAFLQAKSEDQQAIDLLLEARDALSSYYKNHTVAMGPLQGGVKELALAQEEPEFDVSADQAPDSEFSGKGHRKHEAKSILQILQSIAEDLDDEIKNSMKAEEAAQLEYEKLMAAGRKLRQDLVAKKVSLEEAITKLGEEKEAEIEDKNNNEADLQAELDYKAAITDDCDWIIRSFEKRATARTAVMKGLVGAKEYLAGAMPAKDGAALLDKTGAGHAFDDTVLASTRFLGLRR